MKEEKPIRLSYYRARLVSEGPFKAITVTILSCSDPDNKEAPKYEDDRKFYLQPKILATELLTLSSPCERTRSCQGRPQQNSC